MTSENYFSVKSRWFADKETLDKRSMRIWAMNKALRLIKHMECYMDLPSIRFPCAEAHLNNVIPLLQRRVGRSIQEKASSDAILHLPDDLRPPSCYKPITGTVSGNPDLWKIPLGYRHSFFTDQTGENVVDFNVARFVVDPKDEFGPGERWRVLETMAPGLIVNCKTQQSGDFYALMGASDQIASHLGLRFDRNTS